MSTRATLVQLEKKQTPYKTSEKIYFNGLDNNYAEEIERVVMNSPTGNRAKDMMSKFIYGKGISERNDQVIDGDFLSKTVKDVVDDVALQNGSFIHVSYKLDVDTTGEIKFIPASPKSLDYNKCRIDAVDDDGNNGKIIYKNFNKFDKTEIDRQKNKKQAFYPFNSDNNVVKAQIENDAKIAGYDGEDWTEKIRYYRGQVMYLNLTPKFRYAISKFDSVFNDLDTEFRISEYLNTMTRNGFLGKTAVVVQGLNEEQEEMLEENVQGWLGSGKANGVYVLNVEEMESLDDVMKIIQVPSQLDDKQFVTIREAIKSNVLGAANNLPTGLVFSSDGSVFDGGAGKYIEMKNFYWEQNYWEREKIQDAFYKMGFDFEFIPFDQPVENNTEI